jgi:pimeloyl-ACP methyl ester carboxylesterase
MSKKDDYSLESGYFEDSMPYAKIGNKPKILLIIEALSFDHKPPSGFSLRMFKRSVQTFLDDYTVYQVNRKANMPEDYTFERMAEDYAKMIRREFKVPVDVIGTSTGGQLAHYLAAGYPDTVNKLVIISAAYRLSEEGQEIEGKIAEYYEEKKYGKCMATMMRLIYPSGFKSAIFKFMGRLIGRSFLGKSEYPKDLLIEIRADKEMNFKDRLSEIRTPTLIISGEQDIDYAADDVRATAEGIPNSKLILYENYGHNLAMANRKEVMKEVSDFLRE